MKIDRAFVNELSSGELDEVFVKTIITLAHSRNLKVVAEGVETEEQLEKLKELNCDFLQGYYFSKAVVGSEVCKMINCNCDATSILGLEWCITYIIIWFIVQFPLKETAFYFT